MDVDGGIYIGKYGLGVDGGVDRGRYIGTYGCIQTYMLYLFTNIYKDLCIEYIHKRI